MNDQKSTQIVFNGKAGEYFGIWIVNLLLTLITFGVYSPWAKVRRKKYFYNNTLIDNVGFDYHAKPIAILKGRAIAFVLFLGYAFGGSIHPLLPSIFMLLLFVVLPWLVVRSMIFNARNTSHRGLRFDFVGKLGEAVRVYVLIPIITLFTLGLGVPFASHQKNQFLMNHHKFGLSQFDMQATIKQFYKVYLMLIIVPLIIGISAAIAIPAYMQYTQKASTLKKTELVMPFAMGFVATQPMQKLVLAVNAQTEEMTTAPQEKTIDEMMKERQEARNQAMRDFLLNPSQWGLILGGALAYALFAFGFLGYLKARIGNLVWNSTTLDKLSFKSTLRARDFIWIYFSNIVAIVCTFGLATPWAQVRLAKYRASKLQIIGDVDFDQFVGDKKAEMQATGEEIADFFDVDLSFG